MSGTKALKYKYILPLQATPQIGQSILVGYLSQYFCEKNSLEEELSLLRASNNSELVDQKEEDIQTVTRNAYLYAAGITALTFISVLLFTWAFYIGQVIGMMCRIVLSMAIYSKVCILWIYIHIFKMPPNNNV